MPPDVFSNFGLLLLVSCWRVLPIFCAAADHRCAHSDHLALGATAKPQCVLMQRTSDVTNTKQYPSQPEPIHDHSRAVHQRPPSVQKRRSMPPSAQKLSSTDTTEPALKAVLDAPHIKMMHANTSAALTHDDTLWRATPLQSHREEGILEQNHKHYSRTAWTALNVMALVVGFWALMGSIVGMMVCCQIDDLKAHRRKLRAHEEEDDDDVDQRYTKWAWDSCESTLDERALNSSCSTLASVLDQQNMKWVWDSAEAESIMPIASALEARDLRHSDPQDESGHDAGLGQIPSADLQTTQSHETVLQEPVAHTIEEGGEARREPVSDD